MFEVLLVFSEASKYKNASGIVKFHFATKSLFSFEEEFLELLIEPEPVSI
jgi:hypothetical protein